jgi:hypothetical protein
MKKIKVTEQQLIKLQETIQSEYSDINELGKEDYPSETPSPRSMAKIALRQIKLHPSFYEDRDKMYEFLEAFTELLERDVERGGLKKIDYDKEMLTINDPQLNEGQKELKRIYERFGISEQMQNQKAIDQLGKTYPAPPPQPQVEQPKQADMETTDIISDKENFKSYFPNKNIEYFRVGLYKYLHANRNNNKLVDKLLKMLFKP